MTKGDDFKLIGPKPLWLVGHLTQLVTELAFESARYWSKLREKKDLGLDKKTVPGRDFYGLLLEQRKSTYTTQILCKHNVFNQVKI